MTPAREFWSSEYPKRPFERRLSRQSERRRDRQLLADSGKSANGCIRPKRTLAVAFPVKLSGQVAPTTACAFENGGHVQFLRVLRAVSILVLSEALLAPRAPIDPHAASASAKSNRPARQ
jgi:hypothetical protein